MKYEIYIDKLIFINFIMNYYILTLVGKGTYVSNAGRRILLGAVVGSLGFLLPLLCSGSMLFRLLLGFIVSIPGMIGVTFSVNGWRGFWRLCERMAFYSFAFGGALLFMVRRLPTRFQTAFLVSISGGMICLFLYRFQLEFRRRSDCLKVTIRNGNVQLQTLALIDSGNSLVEPISGQPVCVVDRELYTLLCDEEKNGFRMIPYHSIGKQHGMMHAGMVEEIKLQGEEGTLLLGRVYIACGEDVVMKNADKGEQRIRLILHPGLLKNNRSRLRRQNVREHGIKDSIAGKVKA